MPLIAIAAKESVEVLKPQTAWPQVKRPGLARHPIRHVVHLAEPSGVVAGFFQDFTHGTATLRHNRVITGIAGRHFRDDAAGATVMITPGDQRRARGRAECSGVEGVEAKALVGELLKRRRLDRTAKRAARTKTDVICHDQENVGCALRRFNPLWKIGSRILHCTSDLSPERRLGFWQDLRVCCRGSEQDAQEYEMNLERDGLHRSSLPRLARTPRVGQADSPEDRLTSHPSASSQNLQLAEQLRVSTGAEVRAVGTFRLHLQSGGMGLRSAY
jgi:hypothetical protein